jgi:glucose/arabinose dehydrogenase
MNFPKKIAVLLALSASTVVSSIGIAAESNKVGEMFTIRASDLPEPYATPVAALSPRVVSTNKEGELNLPEGFKVNKFRGDLTHARWLEVLENGDVLLAQPEAGEITILRDSNGDGVADIQKALVSNLELPHGMAIVGAWLYIGEQTQVRRIRFKVGDMEASGQLETVTEEGSLGEGGGHWTRNLLYSEEENAIYISVGSRGNVDVEPLPRASIQKLYLEDNRLETVASGLRNPVGIDFEPTTGDLYTVVNERDGYGDGLVPDYLTSVKEGGFYGWPYAYSGTIPDPEYGEDAPDLVAKSILPEVLFQSHSAPLGLAFYDGAQFPEEYHNDAFVAFQGSWNASKPTGYKIVRVPFKDGRPTGSYQNFATGFRIEVEDPGRAKVWGRPVGVAVAADGALLVADAVSQTVWRISYGE